MDQNIILFLVVIVVIVIGAIAFFRFMTQAFQRTLTDVRDQLKTHSETVSKSQESMHQRLDNAANTVGKVNTELGRLAERSQRIYDIGKDIQGLQQILKAPKLRGGLGEYFLADLLANMIPKGNFELQYGFKDGQRVDAVIKLKDMVIPVDSKFPLDTFLKYKEIEDEADRTRMRKLFFQDIKNHINAIADKYINPAEGTSDFAVMYIPAESVYYEIVTNPKAHKVLEYSFDRKVIITSPNNFYAYLQAISMGLRGLQIEQSAQDMLGRLAHLQGDFQKFEESYRVLGKHLTNARSSFEGGDLKLSKMGQSFASLHVGSEKQLPVDSEPENE